jgi:hypothetical protein
MPHEFQIPAGYVERAISREGRAHSIEELNGPSTALVPVDMQRCFMEHPFAGACRCLPVPAGACRCLPVAQKVRRSNSLRLVVKKLRKILTFFHCPDSWEAPRCNRQPHQETVPGV